MLPLLYQTSHPILAPERMEYIGRLTKCSQCVVSERLNKDYTVSATVIPTDPLIDAVRNTRFLLAKPNPFDEPQFFEIYDNSFDEIGRLTLSGRHIKHNLYSNLINADVTENPDAKTPVEHWNFINTPGTLAYDNFFTFSSSITAAAKMETGYTKADTTGRFIEELGEVFGGEFHFNNFNVSLLSARGRKKNYILRWNKNIGSPNLNLSTANIYSHVVAYANITAKYTDSGGTVHEFNVQLCSNPVNIWNNATIYRVYMFDASNQLSVTEINPFVGNGYDAIRTELNTLARYYANHRATVELQTAENVNLKVNFRPALDEMNAVGMGDTVDVMLKGGRTVEAKITATSFDSLAERWKSIELGKERLKLSDYIAKRR